jgi:glycosyltransferase involved in cell wall biosynthesis
MDDRLRRASPGVGTAVEGPRVSVVVPTYRRPMMLVEALESVLAGSYSDIEVLVANDGPAEDLEPARSRLRDPRIRWITRPQRLGMLENNLDAFRLARGEFIAHLDDDDRWTDSLLSTLVPILEAHPDVVLAFADHFVTDADGAVDEAATDENSRLYGRTALAEGRHRPFGRLAVVDRSIPQQCACVFRRSALDLGAYSEQVGCFWDQWTSYLLAGTGGAAWYVPQRLAFYRRHAGSDTASGTDANVLSFIYCWGRFLEDDALAAWRSELAAQLAAVQLRLASKLLRDGDTRNARYHARRAAARDPSRRSVEFALAAHIAPAFATRLSERW